MRLALGVQGVHLVLGSSFGTVAGRVGCAALAASLAGCASTHLDAQWVDPQFAGQSLRGQKVLVICEASELVVKRLCQDHLAAQLTAVGAIATTAPDISNPIPGRPLSAEQFLPAARAAGAKAVLSAGLLPDAFNVSPGPSVGIGIGGFGGSRGYRGGGVGAGVGIAVPVGGAQPSGGYQANGTITDVATGRPMWTAKASSGPASDASGQVAELAKAIVNAAQQAGLF